VKIGPKVEPVSAISTSNAETIIVRGHDLCRELLGKISFTDHIWLLVAGALPNAAQRSILDAALVAIAEHGLVPSVQAGRMTLAAAPEALQGAVAAGILGCGSVVLGSSEAAGFFLRQILSSAAGNPSHVESTIRTTLVQYRTERRAIPGYGHPLHKGADPRAVRLLEFAAELGIAAEHVDLARRVEAMLPAELGKSLVINISGAIPAVLLDAGFPVQALKGIPILARTASLIGHLLEEQLKPIGFELSHAAGKAIRYVGSTPPGFAGSDD